MHPKEKNLKKFFALSSKTQEIFLSEEFADRFIALGARHGLTPEARIALATVVGEAILNSTPPFELRTQLASSLGIPPERFDPLFQELSQKLLTPFQTAAEFSVSATKEIGTPSAEPPPPSPSVTDHVAQFQERRKQREEEMKKQGTSTPPPPHS